MHIPDGFIDPAVSAGAAALAAAAVGVALHRTRSRSDDATAPLAGLLAVFVFAAQMINFPVGAGTSGHVVGAALAAILVGPAPAVLAMAVVIGVQALFFADGGLTALGLNALNLAVVAPVAAFAVFALLARVLPRTRWGVAAGAFAAGWVSVLAAAGAFSVEFALGGTEALDWSSVATAMLGVHAVIGIGEGLVTAFLVAAVAAARADLVAGLARPPRLAGVASRAGWTP